MYTSAKKSTIVRTAPRKVRLSFRAGELLAPRLGGRAANRLWFTLPRPMKDTPLPPGGEPFTVTAQEASVRGHVWGDGPVVYLVHGWGGRGSQLAALEAKLRRQQAEFLNEVQRIRRQAEEDRKFAVQPVVTDLLSVADALHNGIEGLKATEHEQRMAEGLRLG